MNSGLAVYWLHGSWAPWSLLLSLLEQIQYNDETNNDVKLLSNLPVAVPNPGRYNSGGVDNKGGKSTGVHILLFWRKIRNSGNLDFGLSLRIALQIS
jgi:hypothetical protein